MRLDPDWAVPMLAAMIGTGRWILALDRTNRKIGRSEVNFLVLAAVTRRFRVPLLWMPLPHGGNGATGDRIALMRRYLARFPVSTIRILLADREFVGTEWLKFLTRDEADRAGAPLLSFAAKRLAGAWLIIVTSQPARTGLDA